MATGFDWAKLWVENIIKPIASNNKLINFLIIGVLLGGGYAGYDIIGKEHVAPEPKALAEVPMSGCDCDAAIKRAIRAEHR